jgi:hypothetical protein
MEQKLFYSPIRKTDAVEPALFPNCFDSWDGESLYDRRIESFDYSSRFWSKKS